MAAQLIDVDLGGANLHTLLGVPRPRRTLSHFLSAEVRSLADLMVPTSVPNLSLVSGNEALLEMANPKSFQKEKLFRQIRRLDTDEVLLDLGGGSAFTVLDSLLLAGRGLVVDQVENLAHRSVGPELAARCRERWEASCERGGLRGFPQGRDRSRPATASVRPLPRAPPTACRHWTFGSPAPTCGVAAHSGDSACER
jgi:hypothetical protein